MTEEILFTFPNTRRAIAGEKALEAAGLSVSVMPMPEALSDQCGIVLRLPPTQMEAARAALDAAGVEMRCVYRKQGDELVWLSGT